MACGIALLDRCFGPVFRESTVARIRPGDTREHVLAILGAPNDGSNDSNCWYYQRALNPGWLTIGFDSHGVVTYVDHERAFHESSFGQ